jgi:hypothetical protein
MGALPVTKCDLRLLPKPVFHVVSSSDPIAPSFIILSSCLLLTADSSHLTQDLVRGVVAWGRCQRARQPEAGYPRADIDGHGDMGRRPQWPRQAARRPEARRPEADADGSAGPGATRGRGGVAMGQGARTRAGTWHSHPTELQVAGPQGGVLCSRLYSLTRPKTL